VGDVRRLIVFDLDGTLIDSRRDLADSASQLIEELGGPPLAEDAIGRMVGEGAAVLVRRALAATAIPDTPAALPRFLEIYDARLLNHTHPYDGIPAAVRAARTHGRIAVLTNKPAHFSERLLEHLDLRDLVDDVVGGDGPWPRKPDPAALQALMKRANVGPSATLLVGDSMIDHETARRAHARYCLAAYGFGYQTFPADRLTGEEWIAAAPSELADIFERFRAGV
jgi:phosphoglycolate phosphatase